MSSRPVRSVTPHRPVRRRTVLATATATAVAMVAGCVGGDDEPPASDPDEPVSVASATQYQGPDCACCDEYPSHLSAAIDGDLDVVETDDLAAWKADAGVPRDLWSCHTVVLDGTVFEGHLPTEPVVDFLASDSDALGIALPGMPSGSPGMGGEKDEPWTIYEFFADGDYAVYTEV